MFYPPILRNIPSQLPGKRGYDIEYSGSLEFCSKRWRCGDCWPLLISPHLLPFFATPGSISHHEGPQLLSRKSENGGRNRIEQQIQYGGIRI